MPNDLTGGGTRGFIGTLGIERFNAHGCGTMLGWLADVRRSRFCRPYSQVGEICGVGGVTVLVVKETGEAMLPESSSFSISIFSSSSSSKDLSSTSRSSKSVEESRSGDEPWYCSSRDPSPLWLFSLKIQHSTLIKLSESKTRKAPNLIHVVLFWRSKLGIR